MRLLAVIRVRFGLYLSELPTVETPDLILVRRNIGQEQIRQTSSAPLLEHFLPFIASFTFI